MPIKPRTFTAEEELSIVARYGSREQPGEPIRSISASFHTGDSPIRAILRKHGRPLHVVHRDPNDKPVTPIPALDWRLTSKERAERQRGGKPRVGR